MPKKEAPRPFGRPFGAMWGRVGSTCAQFQPQSLLDCRRKQAIEANVGPAPVRPTKSAVYFFFSLSFAPPSLFVSLPIARCLGLSRFIHSPVGALLRPLLTLARLTFCCLCFLLAVSRPLARNQSNLLFHLVSRIPFLPLFFIWLMLCGAMQA